MGFDQRLKQQQILEQKAKKKKKKLQKQKNNKKETSVETKEIDLALPELPKGPWSFKLGSEYDSKPTVPSNVMARPQFNYAIPFKQLQQRQFMNEDEKTQMDEKLSWKMPSYLIRRTDYGTIGSSSVDVPVKKKECKNEDAEMEMEEESESGGDEEEDEDAKKKRELIELYKLAKQAQKLQKK